MVNRRFGNEIAKLLGLASIAAATDLVFPLYTHPGTDGTNWAEVRTAISNNPNLAATIVINVENGPGSGGPDDAWVAGGKSLADLPNVSLIGYVHSLWCQRPAAEVQADIEAWSAWRDQGVNINGIFIDEAPADGTCVDYMEGLTTYTRDTAGLEVLVYNPGFPATPHSLDAYYALGPNYISALETCFATETNGDDQCDGAYTVYDQGGYGTTIDSTLRDWVGEENYGKTAILIHGFHSTNGMYEANDETLRGMLDAVVERGIGGAIFTTNHWITPEAPPADIGTVASALAAANVSDQPCEDKKKQRKA